MLSSAVGPFNNSKASFCDSLGESLTELGENQPIERPRHTTISAKSSSGPRPHKSTGAASPKYQPSCNIINWLRIDDLFCNGE